MLLTAKTEYACLAVLELALHQHEVKPLRIVDISSRQGIPSRFLVQILLQLKAAGIVTSIRGASGGYRLSRPANTITLGEVTSVVAGESTQLIPNATLETPLSIALFQTWNRVATDYQSHLDSISFDDLLQASVGQSEGMYYI